MLIVGTGLKKRYDKDIAERRIHMANRVETYLVDPLFEALQNEHFMMIATIDYETGSPNMSAISWVFAPDRDRIYFAIEQRSRISENIVKHPAIVLSLFANESIYSINGNAHPKQETLVEIPLKLSFFELSIVEVRDVMFYGAKITTEPSVEKTYDEKAAMALDSKVLEALKKLAKN
jgi:Pyridoxamine 5'-phosphate oxidase